VKSKLDRLLVGVDGSEDARRALEWGMVLARICDAELIVAHAAGLLAHLGEGDLSPTEGHKAEMRRALEEDWSAPLVTSGVSYRTIMPEGPPVMALLDVATSEEVDLIVVGRRGSGSGGTKEVLLGSTSHQLVERAHRPVLVVPPAAGSV
jgi:nucleotide-binding universal stress UspA family protein